MYICIKHTYLFHENPSGIQNSLNSKPELLADMNDDLPVKVGHYIWGHDLEGGQGDMMAFIYLSLNFASLEKFKRITIL